MAFFERLSNGWQVAKVSFKVLNAHKSLILFPVLSGLSFLFVIGSVFTGLLARAGWRLQEITPPVGLWVFVAFLCFYFLSYFIIVFFNMALIHCTTLHLRGETVSVAKGLKFSMSKIKVIASWALFAGSVGTLLRMLMNNRSVVSLILGEAAGVAWSVASYMVVPVLAYEDLGPYEAISRSVAMMKEKWEKV